MPCEVILKKKWSECNILRKYYHFEEQLSGINLNNPNVRINKTIWFYWDNGIKNSPVIVKKCYTCLLKYKPVDWDIISLDYTNYKEYIHLPNYLELMLANGDINKPNWSDLLRTALLYSYGGIWMDATCMLTKKIPDFVLEDSLFFFSTREALPYKPTVFDSWFIRANKDNYVLELLLKKSLGYQKHKKKSDDVYFYWYYLLYLIIQNSKEAAKIVSTVKYCHSFDALLVQLKYGLDCEYDENLWEYIKEKCFVQKLTYKYDQSLEQCSKKNFIQHLLND